MQSTFIPQDHESKIYDFWEKKGYLAPKNGQPYTVIMPPPNANASLHAGHGMYTVDDIMIRFKRLQGFASLWIPGMDHAGFETQFVFEKQLQKQGKSRLDFDRETLYRMIFDFVKSNSGLIYDQFRRLGFLADWQSSIFTLDQPVIDHVYETFKMMVDQGLVYRDDYLVNYCPFCGTSLAELEIKHMERKDPLYYIKYKLIDDAGFVTVATVRPEPIFADTHLAVNPTDNKHKQLAGKKVINPLTGETMEIITDEFVDPEFGTGVVKLTPAHDPNDFAVAKKLGLPIRQAINWQGRLHDAAGEFSGMKVKAAREAIVKHLQEKGSVEKIDENYTHAVSVCYKCGRDLEPLTIPNWFISVDKLKAPVIEAVKKDKVVFTPRKFKKQMLDWLNLMHDWPISRQIVWGIRIPVWYQVDPTASNLWVWWLDDKKILHQGTVSEFLKKGISLESIEKGLQKVYALTGPDEPKIIIADKKPSGEYLPETDTFDTWFSSGQWPLVTTHSPTDFMGTLSDILKFWISRMILFSLFRTGKVPFKDVYLWSMVADSKGVKMSKSKGNVVNPIDLVDKYGADAFRASLLFGIGEGGTVILAEDKVRAMRNFANKIWNVGRFILMNRKPISLSHSGAQAIESQADPARLVEASAKRVSLRQPVDPSRMTIEKLEKEFADVKKQMLQDMEKYRFSKVFDFLYEFLWHRFADFYIEQLKDEAQSGNIEALRILEKVYTGILVLLHPFVPFVTEAVWKEFYGAEKSILDERI